jgi:hypothetical protein
MKVRQGNKNNSTRGVNAQNVAPWPCGSSAKVLHSTESQRHRWSPGTYVNGVKARKNARNHCNCLFCLDCIHAWVECTFRFGSHIEGGVRSPCTRRAHALTRNTQVEPATWANAAAQPLSACMPCSISAAGSLSKLLSVTSCTVTFVHAPYCCVSRTLKWVQHMEISS